MEPIKTYDYLVLTRRRVLDWVRSLAPEQYAREFPFGNKTFTRTLTHMLISEWYYIERISGREVPPYDQWPIRDEAPPPLAELESAWTAQADRTRAALGAVRDWDTELEYQITDDDGTLKIVNATPTDIFTQLALHEVHHRSQLLAMLRTLGAELDDIDYNIMMYRRRDATPA